MFYKRHKCSFYSFNVKYINSKINVTKFYVGNLGSSERDRIRYNNPSFIAGVEAASKLMGGPGSGTPFQVVPTEHVPLQMMPTEQGTLQYLCAAAAATAPPPAPPSQHLQVNLHMQSKLN